jgi:hypothetical protein
MGTHMSNDHCNVDKGTELVSMNLDLALSKNCPPASMRRSNLPVLVVIEPGMESGLLVINNKYS